MPSTVAYIKHCIVSRDGVSSTRIKAYDTFNVMFRHTEYHSAFYFRAVGWGWKMCRPQVFPVMCSQRIVGFKPPTGHICSHGRFGPSLEN